MAAWQPTSQETSVGIQSVLLSITTQLRLNSQGPSVCCAVPSKEGVHFGDQAPRAQRDGGPHGRQSWQSVAEVSLPGLSLASRLLLQNSSHVDRRSMPSMGYMTHTVSAPSLHGKSVSCPSLPSQDD